MPSSASADMVTSVVERMLREDGNDDRYIDTRNFRCRVPNRDCNNQVNGSSRDISACHDVARWIPRSISPFLNLTAAMLAALPSDEP